MSSTAEPVLYFAYGTLLGRSHAQQKYPSAQESGTAVYPDHALGFYQFADAEDGGCTIIDAPEADLLGVLYRVSEQDAAGLLARGDDSGRWEELEVAVTTADGSVVTARTLRAAPTPKRWQPDPAYARLIVDGAHEAGLPEEYQDSLKLIVGAAVD